MLKVKELRIHYGRVEAVKGISLHLEEKGFICLIGANGAGKSTSINAISGLKRATSGEIEYQGERIDTFSAEKIARIGIIQIPEGRRLFPYINVVENLMVGAYVSKDKVKIKRRLEEVFSHFPVLVGRQRQQAGSLSGGEQQMVAFGRALMADPKLLMLDEPTLGLAPKLVVDSARFLVQINKSEGIAMILVEQNAKLALSISKRGYVLETGSIALEGESSELANSEHVKKAYLGM